MKLFFHVKLFTFYEGDFTVSKYVCMYMYVILYVCMYVYVSVCVCMYVTRTLPDSVRLFWILHDKIIF